MGTDNETEGTAIVVKLDDLLHARRMTLTELSDRIGLTLANLSILKTGKAKAIRFSTLEALCRELDCQPGDILVWDPDAAAAADVQHGRAVTAADVPEGTVALAMQGVNWPRHCCTPKKQKLSGFWTTTLSNAG